MGEDARIVVREDCMFSTGIWVKTSDMHAIVDIETGDMVNADPSGGTIEIERHVWLGQDALVVNPLTVGAGAIIGARSFLNRSVPPKTGSADVLEALGVNLDMDEDTFNGERMDESIQGSTNGQRHQPQERPQLQQHAQTPQEVAVPTYDMDIGETPSTSYYMLQANA